MQKLVMLGTYKEKPSGAGIPQPHLAGYAVPPMQKLMMLGTYKEKHKAMASFPIREAVYNFLWQTIYTKKINKNCECLCIW